MFIYFSDLEKEQANNSNLVDFLQSRGEPVKRAGREYVWQSPGGKVSVNGSEWYSQYEQTGGGAILFVRKFFGCTFPEAVRTLLGQNAGTEVETKKIATAIKEIIPYESPKKHTDMRRVYGYLLNERLLDRDVVYAFAHAGILYEEAEHHNAVFLGTDNTGKPCHSHQRSTVPGSDFKNNVSGSIAEYSFHWVGTSDRLYVFEAPIDMLAFISLHKNNWQQHSYVSLCSTADRAAVQMLRDYPNLRSVFLCLDHDSAGIEGAYRIAEGVRTLDPNYAIWRVLPQQKDWDEDIKVRHGRDAIPASEHPKLEYFTELYERISRELSENIQQYIAGERQQKYKGTALFALVRSYLDRADMTAVYRDRIDCMSEACKSLLLGCYVRCTQMKKPVSIENITEKMKSCYKPHRDYDSTEKLGTDIRNHLADIEKTYANHDGLSLTDSQTMLSEMIVMSADCLRQCGNTYREEQAEESAQITQTM